MRRAKVAVVHTSIAADLAKAEHRTLALISGSLGVLKRVRDRAHLGRAPNDHISSVDGA